MYLFLSMKRLLINLSLSFLLIVLIGGFFVYKNYEGLWLAIKKPPENIGELIRESEEQSIPQNHEEGKNETSFPLEVPEGFKVSIFAEDLDKARDITSDPNGNIIVSSSNRGIVYLLVDSNQDGIADENKVLIQGLNSPHGLAFLCEEACKLYVAETDKLSHFDYDLESLEASNKKKILDLNTGGRHWTRSILFKEIDGKMKLLISSGSSCDTCHEDNWQRGKVLIVNPDGSEFQEFSKGLRNAVFMTLHPESKEVWGTEMGRDNLGDDLPPDELNIIREGEDYGWPICYGKNIHDTVFDKNTYIRNPCEEPFTQASHIDLQAHSAPLGLTFVPETWPEEYRGNLLVAYHGSWNRSEPTGYKVMRFILDEEGNEISREDFLSGWLLENGESLGRVVDVHFEKDELYISDDKAGVIYRVIEE